MVGLICKNHFLEATEGVTKNCPQRLDTQGVHGIYCETNRPTGIGGDLLRLQFPSGPLGQIGEFLDIFSGRVDPAKPHRS
jgi:hypothetical protein